MYYISLNKGICIIIVTLIVPIKLDKGISEYDSHYVCFLF